MHDLVLESGWTSGEVRPGQTDTVTMGPLDTSATAWCSVPGHQSAGMEFDVVIAAPDA